MSVQQIITTNNTPESTWHSLANLLANSSQMMSLEGKTSSFSQYRYLLVTDSVNKVENV
jgi:hypothetical protein